MKPDRKVMICNKQAAVVTDYDSRALARVGYTHPAEALLMVLTVPFPLFPPCGPLAGLSDRRGALR